MSLPRKIRCAVESVVDHGGRVYSVELKPDRPIPVFRPGQFLHLTVDEFDPAGFWPESRVFSIASSPAERNRLRICYSVKGLYTQKMERVIAVGREVWIKLPYGDFVIEPDREVVLVAGGTGISAFAAFLAMLTSQRTLPVTLVYGARSPDLLLFDEMILGQHCRIPALQVVFFTENGAPALAARLERQSRAPRCFPGRISLPEIWPLLPDPANRLFYLAGPPAMVETLCSSLRASGASPDRIHVDAWE